MMTNNYPLGLSLNKIREIVSYWDKIKEQVKNTKYYGIEFEEVFGDETTEYIDRYWWVCDDSAEFCMTTANETHETFLCDDVYLLNKETDETEHYFINELRELLENEKK